MHDRGHINNRFAGQSLVKQCVKFLYIVQNFKLYEAKQVTILQ